MEKELVKLVLEKEYDELTASERVSLREWCSGEEEFEHLKTVMRGVEQIRMSRQFAPRPEVKNSLDALFNQRQTKVQPVLWYNSIMVALYPKDKPLAQRPILQLAAVALLLLMVYPFMFNSDLVKKKEQLAQVEDQKEPLEKAPATKAKEKMEEIPAPIGNTRTVDVSEDFVDEAPMDMIVRANSAAESVAMDEPTAGMTFTWSTAPASVSTHPDGIYMGESAVSYSQSAATQPAVFDLLTTTF
jgi:hypothetical protein